MLLIKSWSFWILTLFMIPICEAMDPPVKKGASYCFDDESLTELEQLCKTIIAQFPPDRYFYIGIGRSPTPIMAWLQNNLGLESQVQIPLSNFKLCQELPEDIISAPEFPSEEAEARLFHYFDQYLRSQVSNGKKWLVIDTAMTGNTLRSSGFALQRYLQAHQQDELVEMLAITENFNDYNDYTAMGMHVAMVANDGNTLAVVTSLESQLLHGGCKAMAPFGELDWQRIQREQNPPRVQELEPRAYQYLVQRIMSRAIPVVLTTVWALILYQQKQSK